MEIEAPLLLHSETVQAEWIDYNGHMNLAYYVLIFDHATDAFLDYIGITKQFRESNQSSTFAAEIHVNYEREVSLGDEVCIKTQLLGFDRKRIHFFHFMHHKSEGFLAATNEVISLYMDMKERRVGIMPKSFRKKLEDIQAIHNLLAPPEQMGRVMGLNSPPR